MVPRLYDRKHAYILQNPDKRIIFAIPTSDYTLIGTTDVPYDAEPADVRISLEEVEYLCRSIGHSFKRQIVPPYVV